MTDLYLVKKEYMTSGDYLLESEYVFAGSGEECHYFIQLDSKQEGVGHRESVELYMLFPSLQWDADDAVREVAWITMEVKAGYFPISLLAAVPIVSKTLIDADLIQLVKGMED